MNDRSATLLDDSAHAIAHEIGGPDDQIGEQRKRLLQKLQISSPAEIAERGAAGDLISLQSDDGR